MAYTLNGVPLDNAPDWELEYNGSRSLTGTAADEATWRSFVQQVRAGAGSNTPVPAAYKAGFGGGGPRRFPVQLYSGDTLVLAAINDSYRFGSGVGIADFCCAKTWPLPTETVLIDFTFNVSEGVGARTVPAALTYDGVDKVWPGNSGAYRSTEVGNDGQLGLVGQSSGASGAGPVFIAVPGETYRWSLYMHEGSTGASTVVTFRDNVGSTGNSLAAHTILTTSGLGNVWTFAEMELTAPPGSARMQLTCFGNPWYDHVRIVQLG